MIRDLANHSSNAEKVTGDVTVIGAGIAGLLVASQLRKAGRKVVVLESGGRMQENETNPLNEVVHTAQFYSERRMVGFAALVALPHAGVAQCCPSRP